MSGKIRRWEREDVPDFIVWGQDIHSVLTTGRHCHTHLCISPYTQMLSMGRLRRDRCNFVKWFSSVLELIIFKFLFKTPIKILLNILINASYIFFNKYFSWTEHQCCSNYFFFLQNLHEKKPQNACIVSLLWFSVL